MADQAEARAGAAKAGQGSFLSHVWLIWKRELDSYFSSPIAYVFISAFLLGCGFLFVYYENFFARGNASVSALFEWMPWLFVILVPAVTMGVWSEERNSGTIEVITTLPLRLSEIVIGKFLGAWSFICAAVLFTLPIPILVSFMTAEGASFPWSPVVGSYIGTFLLGGALCALGMYISSLTRNQILAFVVTLLISALLTFLGEPNVTDLLGENWPGTVGFFSYVSPRPHFQRISRGVIHLKSFVYFLSISVVFLFLNHSVLRSWKFTA